MSEVQQCSGITKEMEQILGMVSGDAQTQLIKTWVATKPTLTQLEYVAFTLLARAESKKVQA